MNTDHATIIEGGKGGAGVNGRHRGGSTHVRVPSDLADRLNRLARAMERAYAAGRVSLPGEMADRVPVWFVIARALDEQESRRERSRRPRRKPGA